MLRLCIIGLVLLFSSTWAKKDPPPGITFLGVGYDLLQGNPEGDLNSRGGVDPGIRSTMPIIKLTYDTNRLSDDQSYKIPDEAQYAPREVCAFTEKKSIVESSKSYQEDLKTSVDATFSGSYGVVDMSFAASAKYGQMSAATDGSKKFFYQARQECNYGVASIRKAAAVHEGFRVSNNFRYAICALPVVDPAQLTSDDTIRTTYMRFLHDWGTHIIYQVTLGSKNVTRKEESESDFYKYVQTEASAAISADVTAFGSGGGLAINMDYMNEQVQSGKEFGSLYETLRSGTKEHPEPIHVRLMDLTDVLTDSYFQNQPCTHSTYTEISERIRKALDYYPTYLAVVRPKDRDVYITIQWPKGEYALPKATDGCPGGVTWHEGYRFFDSENTDNHNSVSTPNNVACNVTNDVKWCFCTKTLATTGVNDWSPGEYCILPGPKSCPEKFALSWVTFMDEQTNNNNAVGGEILPAMIAVSGLTTMVFCCRKDGYATNPIYLPIDKPFYLFPIRNICQKVRGMNSRMDYIDFHLEQGMPLMGGYDDPNSALPYPLVNTVHDQTKIYMCYYTFDKITT